MMLLSRHFEQPRVSYQEPCRGTGMEIGGVDPDPSGVAIQYASCPVCGQDKIVLTTVVPSRAPGGIWQTAEGETVLPGRRRHRL